MPESFDPHAPGPRVQVSKPLSDRHPLLATLQAWGRSLRARTPLPPGELIDLGTAERAQRRLLLELAARHGPVFKGLMDRQLVVCVVGNGLGRRLLRDHASALRPVAIRIESVVPTGFMRRMDGEVHRRYRQALMRALPALDADELPFETVAAQALERHAGAAAPSLDALGALADVAVGSLIALFFGAAPGTPSHDRLRAGFRRLGPHGVVWNLAARQVEAFHALCDELRQQRPARGVMARLQAQGDLDATMLGNLIYMVELGRYDLRGLLRWIVRYAAEHPAWLDRIGAGGPGADVAATAFVQETLRLEQSERLMRDVEQDIRFEGWLIPRGALLRVCLWEAHKDPQSFAQPFAFDPSRFIGPAQGGGDRLAPFGLDAHHCPLAGLSMRIATDFLRVLARDYVVQAHGAEPAVRGPYHWEPSPRFMLQLQRRAA